MNRRWYVVGIMVALLLLAACAVPAAPVTESGAEEVASSDPFRIALIMPSTTTDMAWSQAMYDGIMLAQEELGGESALELAVSENMFNVTDAAAAIRDYASDGYDLVIAHGAQYGEPMFEVAGDFPETSFAWGTSNNVGADRGLENVFAYEANAQEGAYVNGVIAAMLTESNIIGVVGPVEAGDAVLYINGFKAGVADTNPDATVNVIFTGSFGDTALAAEAANTLIAGGADVLTGSAQQVVGSIGVAKEAGVPWLSNDSDQSSLGPDVVVASQAYEWAETIKQMIEMHNAGELGGTVFKLTLANGGLNMIFNAGFELPEDVRAAADTTIQSIIDGSLTPPR
ncbi:MAG: BMP family protein [Caldilineaceae bacterium]|nr:BMP family protein [Caldilineaceae bacterium]